MNIIMPKRVIHRNIYFSSYCCNLKNSIHPLCQKCKIMWYHNSYYVEEGFISCTSTQYFNTTFNNITVISWRSVLLVEETGVHGENHRSVASHWKTLSHNVVHLALIEIRNHKWWYIGTDCIGICKSSYHTITATTAPFLCVF
jgi:hypothetical protein